MPLFDQHDFNSACRFISCGYFHPRSRPLRHTCLRCACAEHRAALLINLHSPFSAATCRSCLETRNLQRHTCVLMFALKTCGAMWLGLLLLPLGCPGPSHAPLCALGAPALAWQCRELRAYRGRTSCAHPRATALAACRKGALGRRPGPHARAVPGRSSDCPS